ncbi:MAG TPA: bifunctional 4-hydroxy-2-oxoglutarate aldolase/2-dehydro-3-deoxy-phosphogluconate aldolase [Thermomicrobiales bacterium]|nr:bifunctional 4-hydroxy-2-oxoglutarate aldolase/2-dehydro-3-deoxy-phosphogluconate aldolase [Thermomicrobiales bacterium]
MPASVDRMEAAGVIAIVRLDDYSRAVDLTRALLAGGIDVVEFTYTNPAAGEAIAAVKGSLGDAVLVGAGTVLDPETARAAIIQGADLIVTPTVNTETIRLCQRYSVPTVIGAFTPTEILTAWEAGATFVKVFPASAVGARYLKDVRGPLPQVRLIPTGGVSVENAGEFIQAGARAVALGSNLVDGTSVANGDWATITNRAQAAVNAVATARQQS